MVLEPLLDDEFVGAPRKRVLAGVIAARDAGKPVVGVYCCYAPIELVWAAGGVMPGLCGTSRTPIEAAEEVLPASLCPLIKASFGHILTDTCPFFALSDAVVAETTCDGKKKMYELIHARKPMITLELPQMPDQPAAAAHWLAEIGRLRTFLETTFSCAITDERLEAAISLANRRRRTLLRAAGFARPHPPYVTWSELNALLLYGYFSSDPAVDAVLDGALDRLEQRQAAGSCTTPPRAPRVLVTGCPLGGDAEKVFRVIEEVGGVVVAQEACTGLKPFYNPVAEGTGDPLAAIAQRYLELPCSCMTPNTRRLHLVDDLIAQFRPAAVVDVVLSGCHTYNIESYTLREHVTRRHGLPFLKIETDYSESDTAQLATRVEALLEMC